MALIVVGAVLLGIGLLTQLISGFSVLGYFLYPILNNLEYVFKMIERGYFDRLLDSYFSVLAVLSHNFMNVLPKLVFFVLGGFNVLVGLILLIVGLVKTIKKKKAAAAAAVAKPETEATN